MSVVVKGMEMPENCQNCFASDDECRFCRAAKKYIPMLGKPKFCPLIVLPDRHGRLVDADEIKNKNPLHMELDVPYVTEVTVGEIIDDAPTIVESEGE